jgi:WD40 repeat protein
MASASADNTVVLWAGHKLAQPVAWDLPQLNHDGPVTALAFAPDGRTLAARAEKGAARLWDLSNPAHPHGRPTKQGHVKIAQSPRSTAERSRPARPLP